MIPPLGTSAREPDTAVHARPAHPPELRHSPAPAPSGGARFAERAIDALAFAGAAYQLQRQVLLLREGVGPPLTRWVAIALAASVLLVLAGLAGRHRPRPWTRATFVLLEGALLGLPIHAIGALSQSEPTRFGSHAWITQEWTKLPLNLALIVRVSPGWALAHLALAALLVRATGSRTARGLAMAIVGLALAGSLALLTSIGADDRIVAYAAVFGLPWLGVLVAAAANRPRWQARTAFLASIALLLLVSYAGLLPLGHAELFLSQPGVRRLYPSKQGGADFPLAFLRDFQLDSATATLFTSFGPTSGLVRIRGDSGEATLIPTPDDLVRHLAPGADPGHLLALEWVHGDLLTLTKDPFAIAGRLSLTGPKRYVPMSFLAGRRSLAVVFTEEPGLVEIDRASGAVGRTLDFRELGLTRFRSGAWEMVGDVDGGFVVVEVGATDEHGTYRLARIDLERFEVERSVPLPDGGLGLLRIPEHAAVLSAGFFTDRITELDERTLAIRRTLRGPLNCRALVYDGRRDVILASAFLPGELWAIRYGDGTVLRRDRIGNKSLSMALDSLADRLYVGSRDGIFEVDLGRYLGEPVAVGGVGPGLAVAAQDGDAH